MKFVLMKKCCQYIYIYILAVKHIYINKTKLIHMR